jgi:hypothetical protein
MAFSIMCMFLTVLYAGFAGLSFAFSKSIIEELAEDEREDTGTNRHKVTANNFGYDGYIGERFDIRRGFISAAPDKAII